LPKPPQPESQPRDALCHSVLWVGDRENVELALAHAALGAQVELIDVDTPRDTAHAVGTAAPLFGVLASDRPGRFTPADALLVARSRPLMPVISAAASLVDGRRRSGPPLPGVEEIPWHDLGARCRWWLAAIEAGIPASIGLPTTARREERLLEAAGAIRSRTAAATPLVRPSPEQPRGVSLAAWSTEDAEALADLLALTGHAVVNRSVGRPRLDEQAAALVWDAGRLTAADLEWLRLLAANRPGLLVTVLESFPRGDSVAAALRAGAAAVLGRPVVAEALAGSLLAGCGKSRP
jgi:hypothetical protein